MHRKCFKIVLGIPDQIPPRFPSISKNQENSTIKNRTLMVA